MIKKMKIVYCIPALHWSSGMERVITQKANYFAEVLSYDIYIIITDGREKKPYFQLSPLIHLINLNINFDDLLGKSFWIRAWGYFKKQRVYKHRLSTSLKQIKPDITISTLRREINFINSIKDGSIKIGEFHFSRVNYRDFKREKVPAFIQKIVGKFWMNQLISKLKRLDQFIVLTNEDKLFWFELENVKVISNPLSFFSERTSDSNNKNVIAIGRYSHEKGFDLLADAWKMVNDKHPDWILRIFGFGNNNELKQQIQTLNLIDTCILEPAVSNIEEKLQESSIFVLSSRWEGMPLVLLEAISCGVPPVSFACPCGPRDIIHDKEDGLLVENGNIKELAEKICYLIENEDERKRMGKQARINAERFKIEHIGKQWETLFEDLLKRKRS